MLLDRLSVLLIGLEWIRGAQIPLEEAWHAIPISIRRVNHTMQSRRVLSIRPLLDQVSHVDDENVFNGGHRQPFVCWCMVDLQAILAGLLEEDGHGPEIGVRSRTELSHIFRGVGWVVEELEVHDWFVGEGLEHFYVVPKTGGEHL